MITNQIQAIDTTANTSITLTERNNGTKVFVVDTNIRAGMDSMRVIKLYSDGTWEEL